MWVGLASLARSAPSLHNPHPVKSTAHSSTHLTPGQTNQSLRSIISHKSHPQQRDAYLSQPLQPCRASSQQQCSTAAAPSGSPVCGLRSASSPSVPLGNSALPGTDKTASPRSLPLDSTPCPLEGAPPLEQACAETAQLKEHGDDKPSWWSCRREQAYYWLRPRSGSAMRGGCCWLPSQVVPS